MGVSSFFPSLQVSNFVERGGGPLQVQSWKWLNSPPKKSSHITFFQGADHDFPEVGIFFHPLAGGLDMLPWNPPKNVQVMRTVTLWQDKADGLSGCCSPKDWWFRIGGTNMATKMATKFLFPSSSKNKNGNPNLAFDFFELISSNFKFCLLNFWPRIYQFLNLSKIGPWTFPVVS